MRLVADRDGVLEINWTWLPFWLSINPQLKDNVETELRSGVLLGGVTNAEEDMDAMHAFVVRRLQEIFPAYSGLDTYLDAVRYVEEPPELPL